MKHPAHRVDAVPGTTTFADLRIGDFMTAEGPDGRWVEVVGLDNHEPWDAGKRVITFKTPEPVGFGRHDRWVIERDPTEEVTIDLSVREG